MGPTENASSVKPGALCRVLRIVATLAALYALVCLGARWLSTKLLFPAPPPSYDATLPGLVMIPGEAGLRVAALHRPNPQAKHLLLYFHGNGEDLGATASHTEELAAHGFAVLAVDYPGYGLTGGKASEAGFYAAADAAYRHATGALGWAPERIIIDGRSLGGAAAVWVASREKVGGLILQSAFVSAYRAKIDAPLLLGERMPSLARMKTVRCPVLVIHGFDDGLIAWSHGRRLYEAAPEPKRFLWVPKAGHNNLRRVAGASYWRAIAEFEAALP